MEMGGRGGTGGEETSQAPGKGFISLGEGGQIVRAYVCVCKINAQRINHFLALTPK